MNNQILVNRNTNNHYVPLTDASDRTSEFKPERDSSTNGCEASVEGGILKHQHLNSHQMK